MISIPALPSGFSNALLTEILQEHGCLPSTGVVSSLMQSLIGDGTGMMAELAKLNLTYRGDQGAAPATLIAKFSSQNPVNRDMAMNYNLYEREARFFGELSPKAGIKTPAIYFVGFSGDQFLILMEDLSDYAVGSQVIGADLHQSELAIDELVKLHGAFWGRVSALDWVPSVAGSYHADNMVQFSAIGAPAMIERFSDYLTPNYSKHLNALLAAIPALQDRMSQGPVTFCHGDFRMENLLYGTDAAHAQVMVIDFQGPLKAIGMNDVALFLGQSTQTVVRRAHERALIQRYVEGLQSLGTSELSFDTSFESYRLSVLYNWIYVSVVAGTLDVSNPKAYAWMAQMVARQSAASDDLGCFDLLKSIMA